MKSLESKHANESWKIAGADLSGTGFNWPCCGPATPLLCERRIMGQRWRNLEAIYASPIEVVMSERVSIADNPFTAGRDQP
ncbi:hypothetical protein NKJ90_26695 [Mesorhizobium sp. M0051]|uniref:hypothetical protein n=1 Tax=unclassified Mesorhizobium TaxID=325217 RepID=UPI0003CE3BCA|nr:hypothetical protein [Mesorhizobium sp. LNHC252B00]ESY62353.1 hypothetical protein X743_34665 [Mesorhizobium sp. LNHC252B00]